MIMRVDNDPEKSPNDRSRAMPEVPGIEDPCWYEDLDRQTVRAIRTSLATQVNQIYEEMGARVERGISCAGEEPAITLYIPREK